MVNITSFGAIVIQKESVVDVVDNSGAKRAKCICVLGGTGKRWACVGDRVVVSVQKVLPRSKISKGEVYRAVVVRTKGAIRRSDGGVLRFYGLGGNSVVLVNKLGEMIGTRVFGDVPRELRAKKFVKIVSLSKEVV